MNDGDWICADPACGNVNFPRRSSCNRCKKERGEQKTVGAKKKLGTEIGKSAADKSRGLFSADDWQCSKCTNVNWARRVTCNVCNAPKFGEVEARTGYGGGYNERGIVEYRRREESSDDEFDEFGRRKKRKKLSESTLPEKVGAQTVKSPRANDTPAPPAAVAPAQSVKPKSTWKPSSDGKSMLKITPKVSGCLSDGSVCDYPIGAKKKFIPLESRRGFESERIDVYDFEKPFVRSKDARPIVKAAVPKDLVAERNLDKLNPIVRSAKFRRNVYSDVQDFSLDRYSRDKLDYEPRKKIHKTYDELYDYSVRSSSNYLPKDQIEAPLRNEFRYRFKGNSAVEDFEVTYSLEERVRAAALAIAYNNCKISADEFEVLYDKPAPDFKTVYAWRQKLLTVGCLNESHLERDINPRIVESPTQEGGRIKSYADSTNILCGISARNKRYFERPIESPKIERRRESFGAANDSKHDEMYKQLRKSITERYVASQQSSCDTRKSRSTERQKSDKSVNRSKSSESYNSVYPVSISEDDNAARASNVSARSSASTRKSSRKLSPKSQTENQSLEDIDSDSEIYDSDKAADDIDDANRDKVIPEDALATEDFAKNSYFQCGDDFVQPTSPIPQQTKVTRYEYNTSVAVENRAADDVGTSTYEYVPTRIDRNEISNYKLFKDNVLKSVFGGKLWPDKELDKKLMPCPESVYPSGNVSPGLSIVTDADWDAEDDALYKDSPKENTNNDIDPPSPPSISAKDVYRCNDILNIYETNSVNDQKISTGDDAQSLTDKTKESSTDKHNSDQSEQLPEEEAPAVDVTDVPENKLDSDAPRRSEESPTAVDIAKVASLVTTINLAGINADDLIKALANIQQAAVAKAVDVSTIPEPAPKLETASESETRCSPAKPCDSRKRSTPAKNQDQSSIPFLDDIFDPGPAAEPAVEAPPADALIAGGKTIPLGSFKSFALPKPLILSRLKNLSQSQSKPETNFVKTNQKIKKKKPASGTEADKKDDDEESEEEEEEGDLSKYDLWGSDVETNEKNAQGSNTAEKPADEDKSDENPTPVEEDKNGQTDNADSKDTGRRSTSSSRSKSHSRSSSSTSDSSSSSFSKDSSNNLPALKNKYDDFNLNSERENSPVQNVSLSGPVLSRKKDPTKSTVGSRSKDKRRGRSRSRDKRRERDRDTKGDLRSRDRASTYSHRTGHRGARDRKAHPRHRPYHSYRGRHN